MSPPDVIAELRANAELYRDLLRVVEAEGQALRREDDFNAYQFCQERKRLLPRLNQSLEKLREYRVGWQRLSAAERSAHAEIGSWLRLCQELIMKILVLDRENEQGLLRRGLLPAKAVPSANRQRPHFVADLYRRGGARQP
ncbi:MAG TPA: hypothetical protein VHH73_08995 [Verrucomicrobiae bacterium]|nr:hypothetical protein [Verrucomicrobiae bacterium]